ncbi:MAG: hypothetical protein PHP29_06315 [Tissierellia bacterium]|nr:hypothetical protein [Tissierellia bacterium]
MSDIAFTVKHYSGRTYEGTYNPIRRTVKIKVDGDTIDYDEHEVMKFLITGSWSVI